MCGIVGYIGKQNPLPFLLEGMSRLEYRGYDSAGVASLDQSGRLCSSKVIGGVSELAQALSSWSDVYSLGIGHLRWATHGGISVENAHPQFDCTGSCAVVHNGIIENQSALRQSLQEKHHFVSHTDTEVIAHYFEDTLSRHADLLGAVSELVLALEGAFACVVVSRSYPDVLIVIRNKSPLCLGFSSEGVFVASDPYAFAGKVDKVHFMEDKTFALVRRADVQVYGWDGTPTHCVLQDPECYTDSSSKGPYPHYMLKEIYEQKRVIADTVASIRCLSDDDFLQSCGVTRERLKNFTSLALIGCGTSAHAAAIGRYMFEKVAGLPVVVDVASEYRYQPFFPSQARWSWMISQSGETADTLEVLRLFRSHNEPVLACTNVATSSMAREASGVLLLQAQREVSVASTKCFTAQLALLYLAAYRIGFLRGYCSLEQVEQAYAHLLVAGEVLESSLEQAKLFIDRSCAQECAAYTQFIFIGKEISYPFAREAALKLKEIAYRFVDCYPSGELKHGPLALVEPSVPVFVFSLLDDLLYHKVLSNAQEVKARNGRLYVFAFEGQEELLSLADCAFVFPRVDPLLAPLAMTAVMQYLMYRVAVVLDCPIDKPRNLAKSLTVE